MGKKQVRTYMVDGEESAFYLPLFKKSFKAKAEQEKVGILSLEESLGKAVGVTAEAVHQWRFGRSAPGDLAMVEGVEHFLGLKSGDLLFATKEESMDRLTDRQRDSVAGIYREVEDYLLLFEQSDGFVWNNYRVKSGSPFIKYVTTSNEYAEDGETIVFAEGADYAEAAWKYVLHALEREWVELGNHPIFDELQTFADEQLLAIWNGKTDPDYRFEPDGPDDDMTRRAAGYDAELARKALREIVSRYL